MMMMMMMMTIAIFRVVSRQARVLCTEFEGMLKFQPRTIHAVFRALDTLLYWLLTTLFIDFEVVSCVLICLSHLRYCGRLS